MHCQDCEYEISANVKFKKKLALMLISFLIVICGVVLLEGSKSYAKDQNVLMPMDQTEPFGLYEADRSTISSIIFLDTLEDVPSNAWDVSENQDGSVMAWIAVDGHTFDLYVAGKGGVWANSDSTFLFYDFSEVTSIDFNDCFHTDNVTCMYGMFYDCSSLESLDLRDWDTSNVTTMYMMFDACSALEEIDISNFDFSNVTDTGYMFADCHSLKNIDIAGIDTSSITYMSGMFGNCILLENVDVSGFDTSNVTDMGYLFGGCTELRDLDVSTWDTSNVMDMSYMFYYCSSLKSLDLSGWDISDSTNTSNMFDDCSADIITEEDQSNDYADIDSLDESAETRDKINTGIAFVSDCIIDELDWIDDVTETGESLETFYDETGVQPFVYFKGYDASLKSDSDKSEYAENWYDKNIDNEDTFLFMYFAEEARSSDVGYMYCVKGSEASFVMDNEAIDIFWDYVNEYWYSDLSTDEMLTEIFASTAEAIMHNDNNDELSENVSVRAGQTQSENSGEKTEAWTGEELTENVPEVLNIVTEYWNAVNTKDYATLETLCGRYFDEEDRNKIDAMDVAVEAYENINTYSMTGLSEGSYVVYVYIDLKLIGIETPAPTLREMYLETGNNGNLIVIQSNDYTSEIESFTQERQMDDDVQDLIEKVNLLLSELCEEDDDLASYVGGSYTPSENNTTNTNEEEKEEEKEDSTKLYVLSGHDGLELSEDLLSLISKDNIETENLNLAYEGSIPDDADCLLIASPSLDLSEIEADEIISYLSSGGNAIIFTDYMLEELPNFDSILAYYGMELVDGVVMESDTNYYIQDPYYLLPDIQSTEVSSDMTGVADLVLLAAAQGLAITDTARDSLSFTPVLKTSSTSYSKTNITDMTTYAKEDGDTEGPFTVGMLITETVDQATENAGYLDSESGANETKVALYSSSSVIFDVANNIVVGDNFTLFMNTLEWACG